MQRAPAARNALLIPTPPPIRKTPLGVAVSWSTAERLGRDSPALAESTFSVDALVARVEHGQLTVDRDTTIYLDEAGMADTARLDRLTEIIERTGCKLVAIGDSAQLPSIGAGGMFDRLAEIAPSAQLSNIRRTLDPAEQRAWRRTRHRPHPATRADRDAVCPRRMASRNRRHRPRPPRRARLPKPAHRLL